MMTRTREHENALGKTFSCSSAHVVTLIPRHQARLEMEEMGVDPPHHALHLVYEDEAKEQKAIEAGVQHAKLAAQ